ncbi:MAG TPA: M48 family metallopeptidase [Candidatus Saccharimonadales bacterium]|jgi:STE24 endopeptidase|nr:M48 family metallopeptidase [Candidatus Saccharimonadales bacterium]
MMKFILMTPATLILLWLSCISVQAQIEPKGSGQTPAAMQSATAQTTAYTLPPEKFAQAQALYTLRVRLVIAGTVWDFLLLLGILFSGLAARFRDWAEAVSGWRIVQAVIAVPLLLFTMAALQLPLDLYQHHVSLQYGLSVQSWSSWIGDTLKGELVTVAVVTPLLWLLLTLIRWSPRRWWLYAWLLSLPLMVLVIFLVPMVLDPMFNHFQPLQARQPQLVEAIERVIQHGGLEIPRSRMYEMDASSKVTTLNAYVTGLGASKRVVVWDTTIQKMTQEETLFVFGHEMGHYVLNHIYEGLLLAAVLAFFGFYLLYRIPAWIERRFPLRRQWRGPDDWAALPVLFLIIAALEFLGQPLGSAYSRRLEHQADIYGLEVTHGINANSQEAAARAFQVLGEQSLSYPTPDAWMVFWYYDHPPIGERVKFAHEYDPWSKGVSPKYVK